MPFLGVLKVLGDIIPYSGPKINRHPIYFRGQESGVGVQSWSWRVVGEILVRVRGGGKKRRRHVRYLSRNSPTRTLEEKRFIPKKSTLLIPADSDAKYVAEFGWTDDKVGWWIVLRVACHQKA